MEINIHKKENMMWPWKPDNIMNKFFTARQNFKKNKYFIFEKSRLDICTIKNHVIFKNNINITKIKNSIINDILYIHYPYDENLNNLPSAQTVCNFEPGIQLFPGIIYIEYVIIGENLSEKLKLAPSIAIFNILKRNSSNKKIENSNADIFVNDKKLTGNSYYFNKSGASFPITVIWNNAYYKKITLDEGTTGIANEFPDYIEDAFINDFILEMKKIWEQENVSY